MKRQKLTSILIMIFILLLIAMYFYWEKEEKTHSYLSSVTMERKSELKAITQNFEQLANVIFETQLNQPNVLELMLKANDASTEEKEKLRQELYDELVPIYKILKKEDVRQFHFHLPKAISFLRVHRPEKFGDDLSDVRPAIMRVNESKEKMIMFEQGRSFYGFRSIFPLYYEDQFIGTVELSYSFEAVRNRANEIFTGHYHFLLNREQIDEKVWSDVREDYETSELSSRFVHESKYNPTSSLLFNQSLNLSESTLEELIDKLRRGNINEQLLQEMAFSVGKKVNQQYYIVTFLPIFDIEDQLVAYFVSIREDNMLAKNNQEYLVKLLLASIIFLIFYLYRLKRWENHNKILGLNEKLHSKNKQLNAALDEVKALNKELKEMSIRDSLTKVFNRGGFEELMQQQWMSAQINGKPISILILDVDEFKAYNDTYGHQAGDDILLQIAKLIQESVRGSDYVCRYGGEEFSIILPQADEEKAFVIAERIRVNIENEKIIHETSTVSRYLTVSIGGSTTLPKTAESSIGQITYESDRALYHAKNKRNCVSMYGNVIKERI